MSSARGRLRWTPDISKSILLTCGCIAGTVLVSILWRMRKESIHPEIKYQKTKTRKGRGGTEPNRSDVDLEAVHEFYKAVQESPLLYPYFMNVKTEKRENVMQNIACMFHKTLQKQLSPADSLRLRAIHKNLNINDIAYNRFTNLFAHICCKGKSDKLRARMLKCFAMLKSEICTTTGKQPIDLASFFELLNSHPKSESAGSTAEVDNKFETDQSTIANKILPEPNTYSHKVCFPRDSAQSLVLGRAKAWSNRSAHEQLLKKIIELETTLTHLASKTDTLDARIQVMEPIDMNISLQPQRIN